jgi:hypothetical protein
MLSDLIRGQMIVDCVLLIIVTFYVQLSDKNCHYGLRRSYM